MKMNITNTNVKQYEPLVKVIARQFCKNPDDQQDLMQEGYIGLMEAAKRYDPTAGVQFESYACWWVRKYMRLWMLNNSQIVRLSCKTEDYYKPLTEDIEKPCYEEDGDLISYSDILTDGETAETEIIRREEEKELQMAIERLSEREQRLIKEIYGIGCEVVEMKEIAEREGLSYDRVKKIHAKCLQKLKRYV